MTASSSMLAIKASQLTVRTQLQSMLQNALTNSPPSRFGGTTLTSGNTLNLRLGESYLPVPTNILVRDFKKFQSKGGASYILGKGDLIEGGEGNDVLIGYVLKGRRAHQNSLPRRAVNQGRYSCAA